VPLLVLAAWTLDVPLSLNFQPFETGVLLVTIILVGFTILNGESSWLIGVMLIVAYCSLSAAFFVHVDSPDVLERYIAAE
jgi:Ca2+:H+ antiporter